MKKNIKNLTLSALFLALGFILPMLTGQVPSIGQALLPMHIPVFLCALLCGWKYGFILGFSLPLLRSLLFTVPAMYPTAIAVALEMATYGIIAGVLYRFLPRFTVKSVYAAMLPAMIIGRIIRLIAEVVLLGFKGNPFAWRAFFMGTLLSAAPGILLQLLLIPAVMVVLHRAGLHKEDAMPAHSAKAAPFVDVYIAKLPNTPPASPVLCAARQAEIETTANERLRREKHYVWRLLCHGLEKSLGLREVDLHFKKEESGAWCADGVAFSLSHSEGLLAVAVSNAPVGIDVERVRPHKDGTLAAKLLTKNEQAAFESLSHAAQNEFLITCFSGKEAVFKAAKGGLRLSEIDTVSASLKTDTLTANGNLYIWAVATDTPHAVRVFDLTDEDDIF